MTNISELKDVEIIDRLEKWSCKEHNATFLVVKYLSEVDFRKLYLGLGYSSLFIFCTQKLKYSESSAGRRILAARSMRQYPEVYEAFKDRKISLVTISLINKVLTPENVSMVVREVSSKGKAQVEEYILSFGREVTQAKESIKPILIKKAKELPLLVKAKPQATIGECRISIPIEPSQTETELKFKLGFYADKDTINDLNRLKELKPYRNLEDIFKLLLSDYLKRNDPKNKEVTLVKESKGRYIPASLRALILKRDNYQCSFIAPDGTRCAARHDLEIDHIVPFSVGGRTIQSNLRALCASHNRFEATRVLGEELMSQYI